MTTANRTYEVSARLIYRNGHGQTLEGVAVKREGWPSVELIDPADYVIVSCVPPQRSGPVPSGLAEWRRLMTWAASMPTGAE